MNPTALDRRKLLQSGFALGAGALMSDHVFSPLLAAANPAVPDPALYGIANMHLLTTKLDELHRFYEQDLGLATTRQGDELTVEAGDTRIVFEAVAKGKAAPFYHFAFNIPENKLEQARVWQKQKTPLIRKGDQEVIHFSRWNAHSVFFNDPSGNILEYIARHDLDNAAEGDFSPGKHVLYASEIGLVVEDVAETVKTVKEKLGIDIYRDNLDAFASMGDEHALLILVKQNRKWTPDKVRAAKAFPVEAAIRGLQPRSLRMEKYTYSITTEPVLTLSQLKFLNEAVAEAIKSAHDGGVPLGCVIVKDGRVIGRGHNRRIQDSDPIMHAETAAVRDALKQGGMKACQGATLYCTGMPCEMCAATLAYWGVKELIVARLDGFKNKRPFYESRNIRVVEVDVPEAKVLLSRYREANRKK